MSRETAVQHTPGPWIVVFADGHSAAAARDEMDARGMIEHADEATAGNLTAEAFPLTLMRAAPGLLAACKGAAHDVEEMGCTCADRSHGHQSGCVGWEHAERIRAAIARAEGRVKP